MTPAQRQHTLESITQQLYTESPYDLGTEADAGFGTGVNYALTHPYILKSVNSHEQLVEALKECLEALEVAINSEEDAFGIKRNSALDAYDMARQALATAQKEG